MLLSTMSKLISLISNLMARKKVEENVVLDTLPEEVKDEVVEVRDEEFHKKHTGAQDNIIYG